MAITTDTQMSGTGGQKCWASGMAGVLAPILVAPTSASRAEASGAAGGAEPELKALAGAIGADPGRRWGATGARWAGAELGSVVGDKGKIKRCKADRENSPELAGGAELAGGNAGGCIDNSSYSFYL